MSTTSIKLKKSSISGRIPATNDLDYGELAINYADGILYFKNSSNQVGSINARAIGVDSTATFSIIDSAYIEARVGSTSNITEGTNLYYTNARVESLVDSAYVQARQTTTTITDSDAVIDIIDSAYIQARQVDLQRDSAFIKGIFSASGDLTYNSGTGEFSIDVESVYTADNFDSDYILAKDSANTAVERNKHDATTKNFSVTVASKTTDHVYNGSGSGNGYVIDGTQSPVVQLQIGRTYRFTLSSSDMSSHPFRFYYDAARNTQYTTNVTTTSTYAEIEITESTPPVLHYQCSSHGYMGHALVIGTRNLTGFTTSDLSEGSNQYYTEARIVSQVDSAYVQLRQTTTTITDSNAVIDIVDSAYIQARQINNPTGVDSAATIALIDSAYVQARQVDLQRDSAFITNIVDSSYIQNRQIKYTNADFADSAFVTTQINNLIDGAPGTLDTLNEIAAALNDDDSAYSTLVGLINAKSDLDSTDAIALIDSAYIQARQINNPTGVDSAATIALIDSAYVQARQINNPSGVDSAATIALIDSAYVQARQSTTGTTDSAAVSAIIVADVDSAYVQARQSTIGTTDSATVLALIDSSHVQSKFNTLRESDNTLIVSGNIIPATDSNFSIGTAEKKFKDIHLSGGTVFIDNLALSADSATRTISIGELDSAGVINVIGVVATVDSAGVSAIVDSAFLEARLQSFVSDAELAAFNYSTFDSTSAINLIDSSYVQARQTSGGGSGLDSSSTIALIDSSYVQARQSLGSSGVTVQEEGTTLATAGSTLNFVGSGITASGTGAVKTITVNGTLDSSAGIALINDTVNQTYINNKLGVDYGDYIVNATNALDILLASVNVDYGSLTAPAGLRSNYEAI
jgi:hypothetical protein